MKLIDRYEFTNGKAFETYYLEPADTQRFEKPECDVIGLRRVADNLPDTMAIMRPDEALIQARMLIDAVNRVTNGSACGPTNSSQPLVIEFVDDLEEVSR